MRSMPRKVIRILLLVLLFAALAPFVYPLHDGKPLLSLEQLRLPSFPMLSLPGQGAAEPASTSVTAYKWRDAQGNWQFASEPPRGTEYQTIDLDPNANLIMGVKTAPPAPDDGAPKGAEQADGLETGPGYSPEKIKALLDKARQAGDALDAHHQSLEQFKE